MAKLQIVRGPDQGKTFDLDKPVMVIGRSPDCEIVFSISAVSREHARILNKNGKFLIEDLKSRNFTFHNDVQVDPAKPVELTHGDRLKICDFHCEFHDPKLANTSKQAVLEEAEDSGTVVSSISAMNKESVNVQSADRLRLLLEISNSLATTVEINSLLPKILEGLLQVFRQADRGFVITKDDGGHFIPKAVKTRRERDETSARFSRTILNKCMNEKSAFLSEDASQDSAFAMAASISDFRIRSIMAAPLMTLDGGVFGIIQVDTQDRVKKFNQDDLQLLVAVTNQAAVALENAKMHEDLLNKQKVERDIEVAKEVQQCFLPISPPNIENYEFVNFYQAARLVGGDFYTYLPLPDGRVAITIGDVAGKGVPAALFMARVTGDISFAVVSETNPALAVGKLNMMLQSAGANDRFVTFLLVILEPKTGQMTLVNAGHVPPIIRRAKGELEEVAGGDLNGLPLGIMEDSSYEACQATLGPGDAILLISDGIIDANDTKGKSFGFERLRETLKKQTSSPKTLGNTIIDTVKTFATAPEQFDDMTMVCFGRVK